MVNYLLIHNFLRPDDGAFIRVKNLNTSIADLTESNCTEIVLVSLRYFFRVFWNDKNTRIFLRRIFLPILWTNNHVPARIWNKISSLLTGLVLSVFFCPDIIVGETSISWRIAQTVKYCRPASRLIIDLHGAVPEELLFYSTPSKRLKNDFKYLNNQERNVVLNADTIVCQSESMVEHLYYKYPNSHAQFYSFQCSVRPELFHFDPVIRERYRKKLALIEDETLFVYCGSLHPWQNVKYSIEIFFNYLATYYNSAKFLIISPNDVSELLLYAYSLGLNDNNIKIIKVSHEEVSGYLNAADLGFLIRDDDVVNRVASPTKLGEYLSCGLPVVVGKVALSWPATRLDSSCFCFVNLGDATRAAKTIRHFIELRQNSMVHSRQNSIALSERILSNRVEVQSLHRFINDLF